jgi:hypothetical protein
MSNVIQYQLGRRKGMEGSAPQQVFKLPLHGCDKKEPDGVAMISI